MDNWERSDKRSLPNKESFYSNLNMENIDDIDYRHGNNVFKRFKLKNLGELMMICQLAPLLSETLAREVWPRLF